MITEKQKALIDNMNEFCTMMKIQQKQKQENI